MLFTLALPIGNVWRGGLEAQFIDLKSLKSSWQTGKQLYRKISKRISRDVNEFLHDKIPHNVIL